MKHHLEWDGSRLNIRCWVCSEILLSISTNGTALSFDSSTDYFEIGCPNCQTACEYSLYKNKRGSFFDSHNWDSDIDSRDFEGETGEINRSLLGTYKSLLLNDKTNKKFFENEFNIVGDFLESLSVPGIDATEKDNDIIDQYMDAYREQEGLSEHKEKLFRRAINRFYRLLRSAEKGD